MHVSELSRGQKDELRNALFYPDEGEELPELKDWRFLEDVPDEILEREFGHINFGTDDFFCTMGQNQEEVMLKDKLQDILDEFHHITGTRQDPFTYYGYDFEEDIWRDEKYA